MRFSLHNAMRNPFDERRPLTIKASTSRAKEMLAGAEEPLGSKVGSLLGGSWVVISRGISRVTILITHIRGLRTPLITTHEPPSGTI